MLFLRGAKHFGFYEKGDLPLGFQKALRKMERKIGDSLELDQGAKVLDAGCGMGVVSRNLARWYGYAITGVDILDFNLAKAKHEAEKPANRDLDLRYLEMDYHGLEFPDKSFNGIYTTETLVHASDPEKVLREFYRVLKPRGRLVQLEYSHDPYAIMTPEEKKTFMFMNSLAAMPAFDRFEHGVQDKLVARDDIVVHLITHVVDSMRPDDSDSPAVDLLADRYPAVVRVPDFAGPSDAKSYIACLDVMIGARMHACIAAFSTGVAVIPVAYSRKFIGLFGDLLHYPHSVAPQGYDADTTVAFILDRIERRIELREAVKAGNERVAPLLDAYEKSLVELFGARGRRLKR